MLFLLIGHITPNNLELGSRLTLLLSHSICLIWCLSPHVTTTCDLLKSWWVKIYQEGGRGLR